MRKLLPMIAVLATLTLAACPHHEDNEPAADDGSVLKPEPHVTAPATLDASLEVPETR